MPKFLLLSLFTIFVGPMSYSMELKTKQGIVLPSDTCSKSLSALSIASEVNIYDTEEVSRALDKLKTRTMEDHAAIRDFYERMIERGGQRYIIGAPSAEAILELGELAPNHKKVVAELARMTRLHRRANEPMQIKPILLLGEPGVGKTHFANKLAKIVGTEYELLSMGSLTAGWILSGANSQWKGSRPGNVASKLIDGLYANPVMVVDELDKAGGQREYNPMGAFFSLLESDTAREFTDEYVRVRMDASHILWIATANNEDQIPEPILSRMDVFVIPNPTRDEARVIAKGIYKDILKKHPKWEFDPEISDDVLDILHGLSPRRMKSALNSAFGLAEEDGRRYLMAKDISLSQFNGRSKEPIGFTR
jgi:ATP-dependent Lon protease